MPWESTSVKNCNSFQNPDNCKIGYHDHWYLLKTLVAIARGSEPEIWFSDIFMMIQVFSPQRNQAQSDQALQKAASAFSSCPYFSVRYFDSEKKTNIRWIQFLNVCWRAVVVMKPLNALFSTCQIRQKKRD